MITAISPQPQRWALTPWNMEYWLYCNQLYNSIEMGQLLQSVRHATIHYADGIWYES